MDKTEDQVSGSKLGDMDKQVLAFSCGALFAGIGGFCLGFEEADFTTRWAVEFDEFAAKTYAENLHHVRLLKKSVEDVTVTGDALEPVDVLHAGFPCQSFRACPQLEDSQE